jgi:DNA gyrase subunit A
MGRNTQGVTLIQLAEGETLAGLEKLVETEDEEPDGNGGNGGNGAAAPAPDAPEGV